MLTEDSSTNGEWTLSREDGKENDFAGILENIRKSKGFTVAEMRALLSNVQRSTLYNWISGETQPPAEKQRWVIARLTDPANPPSQRKRAEMNRLHNLTWDSSKEKWRLKITVTRADKEGSKLTGTRKSYLLCRDTEQAIHMREGAVMVYRSFKNLRVDYRLQKRKGVKP